MDVVYVEYPQGSSLPDLWFTWLDGASNPIPFATQPHTFTMTVENRKQPGTVVFTKTLGFTGYDTVPNVNVGWVPNVDLSTLLPGLYDGTLTAVRVADNKPRKLKFRLKVTRTPGTALHSGEADPPS